MNSGLLYTFDFVFAYVERLRFYLARSGLLGLVMLIYTIDEVVAILT